ncbi:MAG: hypothetical protein EAZ85_12870 [Bacteroidetes bacterium]|nr:MAG: hypothetical protein EAZ85_12870 [Bacteroidota bacterium]TAG85702.1 MAG: hypothetical protein EAZ20_14420 [Bacteroidota bacterium]
MKTINFIYLTIFLFFLALNIFAQDSNTLLLALEKETIPQKKADLMFRIGLEYQKQNGHKKAISYFRKSIETSDNNKIQKEQKIIQSYISLNEYGEALKIVDDINQELKDKKDKNNILIDNLNQGIQYADIIKNYEKAKIYNEQLLEIYQKNNITTEIGRVYNNLGVIARRTGNNDEASSCFMKAINNNNITLKNKNISLRNKVFTHINSGISYLKLKDAKKADIHFNKALEIAEKSNDKNIQASAYNYIAMADYLDDKNNSALEYANRAKTIAEENKDDENKLSAYKILALIYQSEENYKESQIFSTKQQEMLNAINAKKQQIKEKNLQTEIDIEKKESEIKGILAENAKREAELKQSESERQRQKLELANKEKELGILKRDKELQQSKIKQQALEEQRVKDMLAITQQRAETEKQTAIAEKQTILAKAREKETQAEREKTENQAKIAEQERKGKEISEQKNKLQDEKLSQQKWINVLGIGIVVLVLGILFFVYRSLQQTKKLNNALADKNAEIQEANIALVEKQDEINVQNEELQQQQDEILAQRDALVEKNDIISKEQAKAENLLLNILPFEVASELKETGKTQVRYFENITVLFADVKGFSALAKKVTPQELIAELDATFSKMDEISMKYGLERIKTIGDCYMACGGLPEKNTTHAIDVVLAALGIQQWMNDEREKRNGDFWQVRLGMHTGDAVAGVIGKTKFAYDIWGNTVNLASRMESNGQVGRVNISQKTFEAVEKFIIAEFRGEIEAKNIGKVNAYAVERLKPEYASDEIGITPNDVFWEEWKKIEATLK